MNLKAYLIRAEIEFEFFEKKETHTAEAAAKSLGVSLSELPHAKAVRLPASTTELAIT